MPVHSEELTDSLAKISALLVSEEKLEAILELVSCLTSQALPSADGVSVTVCRDGHYASAVFTNEITKRVDAWQYATGEGPCLSALEDGTTYLACDLRTDTRWPEFADVAAREGIVGVLAIPLQPMGQSIGTLNVYSCASDGFDDSQVEAASMFAQQAAVVLANSMAYSSAQTKNGELSTALESRELIGQAKGILMAREGCSADAAFDLLREVSQRTNRKLRDFAQEVVAAIERGEQPFSR